MENKKRRGCGCGCLAGLILLAGLLIGACWLWFYLIYDIAYALPDFVYDYCGVEISKQVDGKVSQAGNYYYEQLEDDEHRLYEQVYRGIMARRDGFRFASTDEKVLDRVHTAVLYDHPEIFWCEMSYKTIQNKYSKSFYVYPEYIYKEGEIAEKKAKIEKKKAQILSGVKKDAGDYEKLLYVYEWVIEHTEYVLESKNNQNIESVFLYEESVCSGYAKAVQYLLKDLDVPATYVVGTTDYRKTNHAWNLVSCEGEYYYLDATWGDRGLDQQKDVEDPSEICYDYFLCNGAMLGRTHKADASFRLPKCDSITWYYYNVNKCYFTAYDEDAAWAVIEKDLDAHEKKTIFVLSDDDVYEETRSAVIGHLADRGMKKIREEEGGREVHCKFRGDKEALKIELIWK